MIRLVPRSLAGQLALLILGAFLAAQVISFWLFADERGQAIRAAQRLETAERAATVAGLLQAAEKPTRAVILEAANSRLVRFTEAAAPFVATGDGDMADLAGHIADLVAAPQADIRAAEIAIAPHGSEPAAPPAGLGWLHDRMVAAGIAPVELRLSIPLADGDWLNVTSRFQRPDVQFPPPILGSMALSLALILGALWLGLRRITGPLRHLAEAAESFGLDGALPAMPKAGAAEVRALSEALNRMHGRLSAMIADRTRMLAALGHDLRSPITALRLRAELVDDDETRERMNATLEEMQEMVEATLAYARGVSADQPAEPVDVAALLQDLAAELSETGPPVRLAPAAPLVLALRRTALRRALRNLMENAQRYGGGASVRLDCEGDAVRIVIEDDGPGIPDADLERVFDPFVRLESSRSRETGGTGLGLPIARSILRAQEGDVRLSNRAGGGLCATVSLPRAGVPAAGA